MSLFSSFIINTFIASLEKQFLSHAPELREAFISEVATELNLMIKAVSDWANNKLSNQGENIDEKKGNQEIG